MACSPSALLAVWPVLSWRYMPYGLFVLASSAFWERWPLGPSAFRIPSPRPAPPRPKQLNRKYVYIEEAPWPTPSRTYGMPPCRSSARLSNRGTSIVSSMPCPTVTTEPSRWQKPHIFAATPTKHAVLQSPSSPPKSWHCAFHHASSAGSQTCRSTTPKPLAPVCSTWRHQKSTSTMNTATKNAPPIYCSRPHRASCCT